MRNSNKDAENLVNAIINKGPFVRFAWGLSSDAELNHHPRQHVSQTDIPNLMRDFNPDAPALFLRTERQTLWPFPQQQASLFTVRTYITDCEHIRTDPTRNSQLIAAINSMSCEQLQYKGLDQVKNNILTWLVRGSMRTSPSKILQQAIHRLLRST